MKANPSLVLETLCKRHAFLIKISQQHQRKQGPAQRLTFPGRFTSHSVTSASYALKGSLLLVMLSYVTWGQYFIILSHYLERSFLTPRLDYAPFCVPRVSCSSPIISLTIVDCRYLVNCLSCWLVENIYEEKTMLSPWCLTQCLVQKRHLIHPYT